MGKSVRTPAYTVDYNGKNITADIAPYVLSITYTDHIQGEADEIEIELENTDGRWLNEWYPEKGGKLVVSLGYVGEKMKKLDKFDVDEIELSGPPSVVRIKGLSAGVQNDMRTRRNKPYEKTTLAAVAAEVAGRHGMELSGKIEDISLERVTQYGESDISFLKRVAGSYGYALKIVEDNKKMVFWRSSDLYSKGAVASFAPQDLISWQFRDQVGDVPTKSKVSYHDNKKKKLVTLGVENGETVVVAETSTGKTSSADDKNMHVRAKDEGEAKAKALATQEKREAERTSARLEMCGDPYLAAGASVSLTEFGKIGGKYIIKTATHNQSRDQGYTTELELCKTLPSGGGSGKGKSKKGDTTLVVLGKDNSGGTVVTGSSTKPKGK